jgi:hypothetical protein
MTASKRIGEEMTNVFLSYAMEDRASARKIARILSSHRRLRVFTGDQLSAGEDWAAMLKSELQTCDIFFVLLSARSLASDWILSELGAAWSLGKFIVPVTVHSGLKAKLPADWFPEYSRMAGPINIKDLADPKVVDEILSHNEKIAAN